jgi:hypothetical protein
MKQAPWYTRPVPLLLVGLAVALALFAALWWPQDLTDYGKPVAATKASPGASEAPAKPSASGTVTPAPAPRNEAPAPRATVPVIAQPAAPPPPASTPPRVALPAAVPAGSSSSVTHLKSGAASTAAAAPAPRAPAPTPAPAPAAPEPARSAADAKNCDAAVAALGLCKP